MAWAIDEATVRHVANLARLKVTAEEVALYARQLSEILDYVNQLNELDTAEVPPTAHAVSVGTVFRSDVVRDCWTSERALANAADRFDGFFKVPKVLEQEGA